MDAEKSPLFGGMPSLRDSETMPNTSKAYTDEIELLFQCFFEFINFKKNLIQLQRIYY